jgi:hypothetical protein
MITTTTRRASFDRSFALSFFLVGFFVGLLLSMRYFSDVG